jgi:hypothetical protein
VQLSKDELLAVGLSPDEIGQIRKRHYIARRFSPLNFRSIDRLKDYYHNFGLIENFIFSYKTRPDQIPKETLSKYVKEEEEKEERWKQYLPFTRWV